jgi:hypothetical protein
MQETESLLITSRVNHQLWLQKHQCVWLQIPCWECYFLKFAKKPGFKVYPWGSFHLQTVLLNTNHRSGTTPRPGDTKIRTAALALRRLDASRSCMCYLHPFIKHKPRQTHTWFTVNPWIFSPTLYRRAFSLAWSLLSLQILWCTLLYLRKVIVRWFSGKLFG